MAALAVFGFGGGAMADPFADAVDSFALPNLDCLVAGGTCDVTGDDADGGADALGAPDGNAADNMTFTSLGFDTAVPAGGVLVLNFTDNVCLDDGTVAADFTVDEVVGVAEPYAVEIGLQGGTLTVLAATGSGPTSLDTEGVPLFNQIKLTALLGPATEPSGGADIDAVTCLNSALAVTIDIKFLSDPNGYNCKKKGVVPVTIFGTASLDVTDINVSTLELMRLDGGTGDDGVSVVGPPLTSSIADRGRPSDAGINVDGVDVFNVDGIDDLDVGFDSRDVADLIGCSGLGKGDLSPVLILTGELNDMTLIVSLPTGDSGADQLTVKNK